ncbi:CLUMA_CG009067, isoform A [Clunio marinus]|uniref:CLUMA_CG009067, isoform A n=1 Tax=Clunio marinus TaxID=568069 RepID=A0A1J1I5Q7_9DIPT|nr:CLUMA_CG009067, isoform A [Clunio marinus]
MNAIDLNEGIDNLSEMRHIVIVFSNFVVPYKTPNEFVVIVDNIFKKLSEIVINYEGIVNKVILFDKDMMFLVIFGLRGLKHEVEARIGLSCASEFHKTFKSWPEIKSVSISVTSGMTYCGVVGHALRREYTVISLTVNKAARLMIAYPAIISCDQETVLLSRMPLHNFKILEKKYMKGLDSNIIAYQFNEIFDDAENGHIPVKYNFPLLGRDELLELAANLLRLAISLHNQRNVTDLDILHNCLIIEGDPQQGKTRSLNLLDEVEIDKARREIFKVLCVQTFKEFSVIFIDSIDFIDVESFALIECLLTIKSIFVFATMGHQKRLSGEQRKFLCETNIMHYRLKPLDTAIQNQLACLYFQVSALSFELENYFRKNSNGNPGWIEKCSKSLVQNNQIHIESMTLAEVHQKGFFYYEEHAELKSSHEKDSIQFERNFLDKCYSNRMENENLKNSIVKVAMLLESLLSPNEFSLSTKYENDLMIFDSLLPYEQVVCKCAAAIGTQFKREMLHYVLSSSTSRMIGKSITKLFELHIFSCASSFIDCHTNIIDENESIKRINCNCDNTTIFRSCRDLPNYASCKALKFQREDFQNVVYQSLTEKQRMDFHKKSLIFLHLETKRCSACGSGKFSELQIENFDFQFHDGVQLIDDTSIDRMMNYFNSIQIPVTNLNINKSIFRNFPKFHKNEVKVRPILLNFLEYDFRSCNCNQILYSTYNNLLRHCHSNDTKLKLIEFKIRLASLCIDSCNVPHAKILLVEATNLIKIYQQGKDSLYEVYLNSKATMLQGKCALKMMQPDKGIENIIAACKLLKISFPLSFGLKEKIKLKILIRNIKKYLNVTEPQNCSALKELITIQSSEILKCIFEFLFERKQYDLAKLAAFWSLEKILKLKKIARNELRLAMEVGKIALNICLRSQSPCLQNKIVPPLYLIMMSLKRFDEALLLLEEFLRNVKMLNDKNGLTWYHALCLDMLLDTGFTIITYDSCNEFYINEMTSIDKITSTESRARFFGNLLLYSVRQKAFEKAQTWMGKLQLCFFLEPYGFFNDSFTSLRIMESFTLCLVHAKEHNLTKISYYETELLSMAASMKNAFKKCWCFKERFKLQKVYLELTNENSERNLDKLENILKLALNNKNFLSYDIIKHNQRFWTFNLPPKLQTFWIDNSTSEKALYLSNYPHNSHIFPFSLSISESGKSA